MRGDRFRDHRPSLAGNHDVLALTLPDAVLDLHRRYLAAGADIITTNTFSSTVVAQRDYGLDDPQLIHEINVTAARLARRAVDEATTATAAGVGWRARSGRPTSRSRCRPRSRIPGIER